MKTTVLDASTLLAMFFGEPGMETMRALFHKAADADRAALISAVNWAEVLYRMERKQGREGLATARRFERTMPLEVVPLDCELAESAAHLKNQYGLGLADAFAAALARSKKATLVTADPEFKPLGKEIKINWLK
ncbi:MAG TPA: PIN domain-containing protein [Verrucomicrobiota bacterium]|jgi:predicted nucleic acid-binding protein|nr:MAG: tRNA(fMet)-specific endonuclease VapC [Verrucomicrobia bacterium ADurb.Bin118]HPY32136.1 PIN domain-containing protein [Verrucomicrobiota bacterium]HQB15238.1 PIN domain-containing protein [Verrucomicrobiota bacterium]